MGKWLYRSETGAFYQKWRYADSESCHPTLTLSQTVRLLLENKMSASINPLWPSIRNLSKQLNLLDGLIGHLDAQLGNYRERIAKILLEKNLDLSILYSGSRLAITDLSSIKGGYFFFGPKGFMFKAEGEEYYQMVDTLIQREAVWTVAHGYESFNTFVNEIAASYLVTHNTTVDKKMLKQIDEYNCRVSKIQPNEFSYWRAYATFIHFKGALNLLRRIDSKQEIKKIENHNNRKINLAEWINIANFVRNATVHEYAIIPISKIKKWPKKKLDMLNSYFPGVYKENGYVLQLKVKHAQAAIQIFAEYAYIIFRSLSLLHGYKCEFTDNEINFS
jgi:hypothetical protein